MSRTYLTLCQKTVEELGIKGATGPASVSGQTGELQNIVTWVADADLYVQNLWLDWQFLWKESTGTLAVDDQEITTLMDLETEIEDAFVLNQGTVLAYKPIWLSWRDFSDSYRLAPTLAKPQPPAWAVKPDKSAIRLSHPVSVSTPWRLEYYRNPTRLANNTDTSLVPTRFDRIIIARAKIIYAEREDAPEILTGAAAEYADTLEKMESFYLPGQRGSRRAQNRGLPEPDFLGRPDITLPRR